MAPPTLPDGALPTVWLSAREISQRFGFKLATVAAWLRLGKWPSRFDEGRRCRVVELRYPAAGPPHREKPGPKGGARAALRQKRRERRAAEQAKLERTIRARIEAELRERAQAAAVAGLGALGVGEPLRRSAALKAAHWLRTTVAETRTLPDATLREVDAALLRVIQLATRARHIDADASLREATLVAADALALFVAAAMATARPAEHDAVIEKWERLLMPALAPG